MSLRYVLFISIPRLLMVGLADTYKEKYKDYHARPTLHTMTCIVLRLLNPPSGESTFIAYYLVFQPAPNPSQSWEGNTSPNEMGEAEGFYLASPGEG